MGQMWYDRETLHDGLGQIRRGTFEHMVRSSAAVLQADLLIERTMNALVRQQEARNRARVAMAPRPSRLEDVAVVHESSASQPSNLIYFPGVQRPRHRRPSSAPQDGQSVRVRVRGGCTGAPS
jgi:hypothetical protein